MRLSNPPDQQLAPNPLHIRRQQRFFAVKFTTEGRIRQPYRLGQFGQRVIATAMLTLVRERRFQLRFPHLGKRCPPIG